MELFDGVPVWHASVAKHGESGLVPLAKWKRKDLARARALLEDILCGVGLPLRQVEEPTRASLQWRRLANELERAIIGPTKDVRRSTQ
jgi:hypothetical protein